MARPRKAPTTHTRIRTTDLEFLRTTAELYGLSVTDTLTVALKTALAAPPLS